MSYKSATKSVCLQNWIIEKKEPKKKTYILRNWDKKGLHDQWLSCWLLNIRLRCGESKTSFTADFSAVYTPWFLDSRPSWFDRHDSTGRLPSGTVSYRNQSTQSESYFSDSLNVSLVIQKKRTVIHNLFSFSDNSLSYKSRNLIAIHVIGRVDVSINTFFGSFLNFFWASTLIFKEISYFTLFQ